MLDLTARTGLAASSLVYFAAGQDIPHAG